MLHVRWLKLKDASEVYQVERKVFGPNGWTAGQFLRRFNTGEHLGVIALVDRTPIGYLVARTPDHGVGTIESVAVMPPVRRQGVATLMLAKLGCSPLARAMGEWVARVADADTPAHHWLKANGFVAECVERSLGEPDFYRFRRDTPLTPSDTLDHAANQRTRPNKRRPDPDPGEGAPCAAP